MKELFVFFYILAIFNHVTNAQSQCETPNKTNGVCIPIRQCQKIVTFITNSMISESDREYLKKSQCRSLDNNINICCPDDSGSSIEQRIGPFSSLFNNNRPSSFFGRNPSSQFGSLLSSLFGDQPLSQFGGYLTSQLGSGLSPQHNNRPFSQFDDNNRPSQFNDNNRPSQFNDNNRPSQFNDNNRPSQFNDNNRPSQFNDNNRPSQQFFDRPSTISDTDNFGSSRFSESSLPRPGTCGSQVTERIIGGMETSVGEYPWLALIEYTKRGNSGGFFCGGSLINEKYVLTAAHCIKSQDVIKSGYQATSVRLGEHDLRTETDCEEDRCADPVVNVKIEQIIVHENYIPNNDDQNNDITLIRLVRSVPPTDYIRPICLPISNQLRGQRYDRFPLFVAGFGKTEKGSKSDVKLKVEVDGFNFDRCNSLYTSITKIGLHETQMCAGGVEGEDSCQGDSGGPLMGENRLDSRNPYIYLAGIVSFGVKCGTRDVPGVYTRVDQYIDWILNHMRP